MRKVIEDWLEQSKHDLKVAKDNFNLGNFDVVALYPQQTVELALKALYMLKFNKTPPKTHDLAMLLDKLDAPNNIMVIAEQLMPGCVISRYPDLAGTSPFKFYSKDSSKKLLEAAEEALVWIKKQSNL